MFPPDPRFAAIDRMDGSEFEQEIANLFQLLGYEVERIRGFSDSAHSGYNSLVRRSLASSGPPIRGLADAEADSQSWHRADTHV